MLRTTVVVAAAAVLIHAEVALACSPPVPDEAGFVVVGAEMPTGEIELDAPLVLMTRPDDRDGLGPVKAPLLTSVGLREPIRTFIGPAPFGKLAFVPTRPLEPNTTYHAVFEPRPRAGDAPLEWSFTTGSSRLPELRAAGVLEASFEDVELETLDCEECGERCETVLERSLVARVQLPEISGGAESLGYLVRVVVTDSRPYDFTGPAFSSGGFEKHRTIRFEPGGSREADVTMPWPSAEFQPCVAFEVQDASGQSRRGEPRCFEQTVGGDSGGGCSFGSASERPPGGAVVAVALMMLGLRRRRSRAVVEP